MDLPRTVAISVAMLAASGTLQAAAVVRSASGSSAAAIQATVDQFRADVSLGGGNNGNGGVFSIGRREINWDGGGNSTITTPLAANGFNGNPAARGAQYSTPGTGFIQSARIPGDDANPALRFGDLNPQYNQIFKTFSNQKLVAAAGSTQMDVDFFLPSSPVTAAHVNGFGAVFTDVDVAGASRIQFFNTTGHMLGEFAVPVADGGLSFLGVSFDAGERVGRVRIFSGTAAIGAGVNDDLTHDVVALDDFIYSEPVPAPGSLALLGLGGLAVARRRRPARAAR